MIRTLEELRPFALSIAKPPSEMTRKEAEQEFAELMDKLPEMLAYFTDVLRAEGVNLDDSPEVVLTRAGQWVVSKGQLRRVKSTLDPKFGGAEHALDLTIPTMSACCYLGYFFGELLLQTVPGTRWQLVTENKRDMDYHRPVIRPSFGKGQLEPARVAMMFVLGKLDKTYPDRKFGDLFSFWVDAFTPKSK
jgi:hypothetical protein